MNSTAVRYFRAVTEGGSIKRAATSLRIAPSAISRQVQAIEEELSVKLFDRSARGMVLTDAGHLLYRYAVENRNQLDGIRVKVQEFDTMRRGQVKIATVEGMLANFLSNFVVELTGNYPGISISTTVMGSRDVAEMVGHNDVDLGLVFGRSPRRDLIELARMRQSLCLIVSPRHPLANRDSCAVKDLAGLRVVVPDPSFGIRQEIDRACANAKIGWKSATRPTRSTSRKPWRRAPTSPPSCRATPRCPRWKPDRWWQCRCATSGLKQRRSHWFNWRRATCRHPAGWWPTCWLAA